ncbi:unnamed protein product [Penicillium glandicola]
MDQTYEEWHHLIEGIGQVVEEPEPSTSHMQFTQAEGQLEPALCKTSLIPHLASIHHAFVQALRVDVRLMIWPESWFPGDDRQSPFRLRPWIQFPQLQEDMWSKILSSSDLVNPCIFPPQASIQYAAQLLQYYLVYSEEGLKQFAHRTLDDFLVLIINYMGHEDTLRYRFSVRGLLNFDRPHHCCVSIAKFGFEEPAYCVLYIPSFCLTLPELVAGLHATSTIEVFDKEPNTFVEHATNIMVFSIVRIYSRMISSGTQYGYIYTGEALVFLHIPTNESSVVDYYLCVPDQDVFAHGYDPHSNWVRRTALGQILPFVLQSLAANRPSQQWHDSFYQTYRPLVDDYSLLLPQAPDDIRFNPPAEFMYQNSFWNRFWGNLLRANLPTSDPECTDSQISTSSDVCKPYCTAACLLGTFEKDVLDENCPNVADHGTERHQISSQEICDRMNEQLRANRCRGFQQLHIVGRTCYLLKATLLSHGYTMLIKATGRHQSHRLETELRNYQDLKPLQGSQIPIKYWYHGVGMEYMLLLSWSGIRTDQHASLETCRYLEQEMHKLEDKLQEHGVIQQDAAFRNVLWNPMTQSFVMIDLEDMKWLKGTVQGDERRRRYENESNIDSIRSAGFSD